MEGMTKQLGKIVQRDRNILVVAELGQGRKDVRRNEAVEKGF